MYHTIDEQLFNIINKTHVEEKDLKSLGICLGANN